MAVAFVVSTFLALGLGVVVGRVTTPSQPPCAYYAYGQWIYPQGGNWVLVFDSQRRESEVMSFAMFNQGVLFGEPWTAVGQCNTNGDGIWWFNV